MMSVWTWSNLELGPGVLKLKEVLLCGDGSWSSGMGDTFKTMQ